MCHDSFQRGMTHFTRDVTHSFFRAMTHSNVTWLVSRVTWFIQESRLQMCHDSFQCDVTHFMCAMSRTSPESSCAMTRSNVTCLIFICDMTQSWVCAMTRSNMTWLISCVTWLMKESRLHMYHDSFILPCHDSFQRDMTRFTCDMTHFIRDMTHEGVSTADVPWLIPMRPDSPHTSSHHGTHKMCRFTYDSIMAHMNSKCGNYLDPNKGTCWVHCVFHVDKGPKKRNTRQT